MTRAVRYVGTDGLDVVVLADRVVAVADLGDGTCRLEIDDGAEGVSEVVRGSVDATCAALGWDVRDAGGVDVRGLL